MFFVVYSLCCFESVYTSEKEASCILFITLSGVLAKELFTIYHNFVKPGYIRKAVQVWVVLKLLNFREPFK